LRPQRLKCQHHARFFEHGHHGAENLGRVVHRLPAGDARQQASLLGRTEDHDPATQIGREPGELRQVVGGAAADARLGAGQMQPFGLCQQPVQADDFQSGSLGLAANGRTLRG
jgi:hypothetical protein